MDRIVACIAGQHDMRLLALATVVTLVAGLTTVALIARSRTLSRAPVVHRRGGRWPGEALALAAAAVAYGCAMWAAHFIAMLAYHGVPITGYDPRTSALSWVAGVAATALALAIARPGSGLPHQSLLGGLTLGVGIYVMHFVGMAAIEGPVPPTDDATMRALALLAGIGFGSIGLHLAHRANRLGGRALAGVMLAAAIVGLHIVAMAGLSVPSEAWLLVDPATAKHPAGATPLALAAAGTSALIVASALAVSWADARHNARQQENRRLRQLADGTFEGILIQVGGVIVEVNEALCRLLGRTASELIGTHILDYMAPRSVMTMAARQAQGDCKSLEIEVRTADGPRAVEILSRPIDYEGKPARMDAMRDLTSRKAAEERIRYLADHDALTGLANRALLQERLAQLLPAGSDTPFAILCIDLDRFKVVNDTMGHDAGDAVLAGAASRLRGCVGPADIVARVGGDEFVIVQQCAAAAASPAGDRPDPAGVDPARAAERLAARLIAALSAPYDTGGQAAVIGASIGIALHPGDGAIPGDLLKRAEIALYRSKSDLGGRYRFYEPAMDERLLERRATEQDLRRAIGTPQLRLDFQPIFDGATRAMRGCEALLRWTHPIRGAVPADHVIAIAEESGLIVPLGLWALEVACATARLWPDTIRVAVNLSPAQLRAPDFADSVAALLARTGLAPARLELEVTESVLIDDPERALRQLRAVKDLGVGLALDDFGTGYASLSYLRRFPFDRIKIDRSFVQGFGQDRGATEIVRAILGLARTLHLGVTAEGIETEAQLSCLTAEGCPELQGHLLAQPMPSQELARHLPQADWLSRAARSEAPGRAIRVAAG